jgi:hypothetical protein
LRVLTIDPVTHPAQQREFLQSLRVIGPTRHADDAATR